MAMAERAVARPPTVAALCLCLCLCPQPGAGGTQSTGRRSRTVATGEPSAASELVLIVDRPSVFVYSPLDANASAQLVNDTMANFASCAYFNSCVYCVGDSSVETWRFNHADGSPLPPGPELNRNVMWPGNGRMANINSEWLVTCGDWYEQTNTCQLLHVNASRWIDIESEACGKQSAVAAHNGSVFVAGGWCDYRASAAVWSLRINSAAAGNGVFRWQQQPDLNTPRAELGTASHKGYLYACGGRRPPPSVPRALSVCERWREGMHSWQSIAPMPEGRYRLHLLSVDGHLIAMGGKDSDSLSEYKLDVFDYNEAEDTWSRLHDMPNAPWFGSAVVPAV